jgi:hypothetical protein
MLIMAALLRRSSSLQDMGFAPVRGIPVEQLLLQPLPSRRSFMADVSHATEEESKEDVEAHPTPRQDGIPTRIVGKSLHCLH